jgi:hypothetical protein
MRLTRLFGPRFPGGRKVADKQPLTSSSGRPNPNEEQDSSKSEKQRKQEKIAAALLESGWAISGEETKDTPALRKDIFDTIASIDDIPSLYHNELCALTLEACRRAPDLKLLSEAMRDLNIPGLTWERTKSLSRFITRRTSSFIERERQLSVGIIEARWLYSGSPCIYDFDDQSQIQRDAAHKAVGQKEYFVSKGMFIQGIWTYPGREYGCKCVCAGILPSVSKSKGRIHPT